MRFVCLFLLLPFAVLAQKPVISPGGVRNAASYTNGVVPGALISIFGVNLAATTEVAGATPLPTKLGGATVTFGGVPAYLLYVSPTQINLQAPSFVVGAVVVTTASGSSDPYPSPYGAADDSSSEVGLFTADGSGCGQGSALNVDSSTGATSVNSSANSASPGDFVALYGTGLPGYIPRSGPDDGIPAPLSPLYISSGSSVSAIDFQKAFPGGGIVWQGRAPGLIGVDQINFKIPSSTREGCAVPVQVMSNGTSKPVTIAIRKGGGPCVDPAPAGYGDITWERSSTITVLSTTVAETLRVSLQESPGQQVPPPPSYVEKDDRFVSTYYGPSCPIPGYRSLDAGSVAAQFRAGSVPATVVPLPDVQASGLTMSQATLPAGTIQPGTFTVAASGGSGSAAFQSSLRIGSEIQITGPLLSGRIFKPGEPLIVTWTGGDPDSWVTVKLIGAIQAATVLRRVQVRASDGMARMDTAGTPGSLGVPGPNEIVVEVTPDPSQIVTFQTDGVSLVRHSWKYSYHFPGIT